MFLTVGRHPALVAEALAGARADFERSLTVLREENSTLRRMLEAQTARADQLTTDLIRGLATQVTPPVAAPPPRKLRPPTPADALRGLGNALDPVKLGDPDGEFASERAASLMAAEDDDGPAAAASA